MFTTDLPEYVIDLDRAEPDRWREVIAAEAGAARRLVLEAEAQFRLVPELLRWIFSRVYRRTGGLYHDEIAAWAEALSVSVGTVTVLNCAYELSHLRVPKVFGCTAGIRCIEGIKVDGPAGGTTDGAMVHVRCLDWPLKSMGPSTRKFRFRRGAREFVAVSVPGCVGVLSGMVPGAYSVTINWAPPASFPTFEFGPAFLLRDTLETCDTYDEAVRRLTETTLSTSVFYTVCGTERDQACVIERTPPAAAVRRPTDPAPAGSPLVQANHHVAECYQANNADIAKDPPEDLFSLAGSKKRAELLSAALAKIPAGADLITVAAALNTESVLNSDTCQQMVFCPARGELRVWRTEG